MIYRDKTNLVINDKYICDFIDKVNSEDFLQMIESVIKNICMVSDTNLKRDSSQLEMINCLNGFKREFTDIIYNSLDKIDLSKITNVINENRVNDMISNERIVENVQRIVSKGSEINTLKIDSIFHKDKLEEINGNMLVMKHILSEIKNYHETKKEHEKCSNQKGKTGENIVFDMLENTLPSKEYTILDCSKKGHSCDILIKRIKYPDIRVECKNYSSNVKTLEIVKFERDLEENNDSGIFISLSSGICGKKNFEIKKLAKTGKFAIYLSNFLDSISTEKIYEFCNIIYMLDENTRIKETNSYEISEELLNTICDYIHTMSKNIEEVHKNMKLAISSLNEIDLKLIEKLIKGNTVNKTEKSKLNNS